MKNDVVIKKKLGLSDKLTNIVINDNFKLCQNIFIDSRLGNHIE